MIADLARLKRVPLFKRLDDPSLEVLGGVLEPLEFSDGQPIFREREPGDALFVLEDGVVVVSKVIDWDDMREKTLALLPKGAFFGEGSFMDKSQRSATVRAKGRCRVLKLSRPGFTKVVAASPMAAVNLLFGIVRIVNSRLRQTSQELVALFDTGKIAGAGHGLDELLARIMERVVETIGARVGYFFLVNPYTQDIELSYTFGVAAPPAPPFDRAAWVFAELFEAARPVLSAAFSRAGRARAGFEPESLLGVPISTQGRVTGAILIGDRAGGAPFNAGHLHLLQGIATQVAPAVENARRKAEDEAAVAHKRHFISY